MKKKLLTFILIVVSIISFSTVAYAVIPLDRCPIVLNASELDKLYSTPLQIHQTNPVCDDYTCWTTTDGGMYNLHERWTCSECGNVITKSTFMGSITDILNNEENMETK